MLALGKEYNAREMKEPKNQKSSQSTRTRTQRKSETKQSWSWKFKGVIVSSTVDDSCKIIELFPL